MLLILKIKAIFHQNQYLAGGFCFPIMADLDSGQKSEKKQGVQMWSCYIPLEAEFKAKQKTPKQCMLKLNRKNVINDFLDGTFAQNYDK